jgi:hypothetical protein
MDRNVQMSVPFKTAVSTEKVELTVLWNVKHMVHLDFILKRHNNDLWGVV